jgi:hypothetical protein
MSNILFQPTTCIHCQGPLPEDREMGNFCSMPCFEAFDHSNGDLCDYKSGMYIRPATVIEAEASAVAAIIDSGHGIIVVDGISCYVQP